MKKTYFLLFLILSSLDIISQNRQGNIVEYFGKEKVESIKEGQVKHIFKEGLILGQDRFFLNSNTAQKDPVFSHFLFSNEDRFKEGQKFGNFSK